MHLDMIKYFDIENGNRVILHRMLALELNSIHPTAQTLTCTVHSSQEALYNNPQYDCKVQKIFHPEVSKARFLPSLASPNY